MTASYLAQARFSKPYLVLWHAGEKVGAWYDRTHRLRSEAPSSELIAYARKYAKYNEPWTETPDYPSPSWSPRVSLDDCVGFVLYDDTSTSDEVARIPNG